MENASEFELVHILPEWPSRGLPVFTKGTLHTAVVVVVANIPTYFTLPTPLEPFLLQGASFHVNQLFCGNHGHEINLLWLLHRTVPRKNIVVLTVILATHKTRPFINLQIYINLMYNCIFKVKLIVVFTFPRPQSKVSWLSLHL